MFLTAMVAALAAVPAGGSPAPAAVHAAPGDTLPPPPAVAPLRGPLYRWAEGTRLGVVDTLGAWVIPPSGTRRLPSTVPWLWWPGTPTTAGWISPRCALRR